MAPKPDRPAVIATNDILAEATAALGTYQANLKRHPTRSAERHFNTLDDVATVVVRVLFFNVQMY